MEKWKEIENFDGYWVSTQGRLWSEKSKKFIKTWALRNGYLQVDLCRNAKRYHQLVHRLVAQAFIPNPENKPQIDHVNAKRTDNRVENLRWCSAKENYEFKSNESKRKTEMNLHGAKLIIERINDEVCVTYPSLNSVPGIAHTTLSMHVSKGKVEFTCKGRTFICPDNMVQ